MPRAKKKEQVNHPSHYNIEGRKECIVEMEEEYGAYITAIFCLMNSYKYLYRAGVKDNNSEEQDRAKAKWYFDWVYDRKMPLFKMLDDGFIDEPRNEQKLYLDIKREFYPEEVNENE